MSFSQSRLIMGIHQFNKIHDQLTDLIGLLQFQMRKTSNPLSYNSTQTWKTLIIHSSLIIHAYLEPSSKIKLWQLSFSK